jgi:hypothetical protein
MSLDGAAIATGIAALTITGVTVYDITNTPASYASVDCPCLFPNPNSWRKSSNNGPATFGAPAAREWLFDRQYSYIYLHAPVGSGLKATNQNKGLSDKEDAIITALTDLDLSGVDVIGFAVGEYGTITDNAPTPHDFYGFILTVTMRERINA